MSSPISLMTFKGCQRINPINLRQVDPGHRVEIHVNIKAWGVTLARAPFAGRRRRGGSTSTCVTNVWRHASICVITRLQLLLQKLILLNGLLQGKEMLRAPVPFQSLGDRGLIVFAALIAVEWPEAGDRARPRGSHGGSSYPSCP